MKHVGFGFKADRFALDAGARGLSRLPRYVGREFAPAGDVLLWVAKEGRKKATRPPRSFAGANDSLALLATGGRRGTRPSGSDSRAGRPRLLLRCSAGRNGRLPGTVPLLISDGVAGGKRPGRMNSTPQGERCRPSITRISGPLWRADWRVRQAEKGLRMFEEAQPTSLRRPRLTGPEGGHPRRGRDSGARFFAFFLVVQQERRSPAGARPGQRHAKHRSALLKRQSIGAISPQVNRP